MLAARTEALAEGGLHCRLSRADGAPLSFGALLEALRDDEEARAGLTGLLAGAPFEALRWELPALRAASLAEPAEFVLLEASWLAGAGRPGAFEEHFAASDDPVLAFPNLGGDALMVVPRPEAPPTAYGHLAAFLRTGPPAQVDRLWEVVAERALDRLADPGLLWISTHGGGVPWLHVRLDRRPKYYGYAPYREDS